MRGTLWRGDIVLGRGEYSPSRKDAWVMSGAIEHTAAMEEAGPLWQRRIVYEGVRVVQQPIAPAEPAPDSPHGGGMTGVPIYASPEPATEVATGDMLVVRDDDGTDVVTEMICVFAPPTLPAEFLSMLDPSALEHVQRWRVTFRLADTSTDVA